MKIEYRVGDLLETDCLYILQGCNAQAVMGSGVAELIRRIYPQVYVEYSNHWKNHGLTLGEVIPVNVDPVIYNKKMRTGRVILNAITQQFYGRDPNVVYVSYDAVAAMTRNINDIVKSNPVEGAGLPQVAMPLIGAGLANGEWSIISQLIESNSTNFQPVVYVQTAQQLSSLM